MARRLSLHSAVGKIVIHLLTSRELQFEESVATLRSVAGRG
jgi:hypothetical protein